MKMKMTMTIGGMNDHAPVFLFFVVVVVVLFFFFVFVFFFWFFFFLVFFLSCKFIQILHIFLLIA